MTCGLHTPPKCQYQISRGRAHKLAHQLMISVEPLAPSNLVHVHLQGKT